MISQEEAQWGFETDAVRVDQHLSSDLKMVVPYKLGSIIKE